MSPSLLRTITVVVAGHAIIGGVCHAQVCGTPGPAGGRGQCRALRRARCAGGASNCAQGVAMCSNLGPAFGGVENFLGRGRKQGARGAERGLARGKAAVVSERWSARGTANAEDRFPPSDLRLPRWVVELFIG